MKIRINELNQFPDEVAKITQAYPKIRKFKPERPTIEHIQPCPQKKAYKKPGRKEATQIQRHIELLDEMITKDPENIDLRKSRAYFTGELKKLS